MTFEKLIEHKLSHKRYTHSLRVAHTAVQLAQAHGLDAAKAGTAGLLHDWAKELPKPDLVAIATQAHLLSSVADLLMPQVLHGPVASYLLRKEGIMRDEEILQAIRFHTTGHADMGELAKVIFISDYVEPGRSTPNIGAFYDLAMRDLDQACIKIIDQTTVYLTDKGEIIHTDMVECRNKLLIKGKAKV